MPEPSSATRISRRPPFSTSIRIDRAPASSEFSSSSFTTDAGRSTTSPAAILFATVSDRTRIFPTLLQHDPAPVEQLAGAFIKCQEIAAVADRLRDEVRFRLHERVLRIEDEEE